MPRPSTPSAFSTTAEGDEVLLRLFGRHYDDAVAALLRLDKRLADISLPFDLRAQLREMSYPPQPKLPKGLPSFIYYYVPNSGWGSQNPFPADPLDKSFVYCSDGIGLNLGCPVRLLRALDALARLPSSDQKEVKEGLASSTKHLATVEELLWLDGWKSPSELRRGPKLPGARGHVDWALKVAGHPVYLEAKFRPSDWPRNTDQGTFIPIGGSFLGKAAHKFPSRPSDAALHLVGITGFENISREIVHLIGRELEANPQIHGAIFRSFAQMTHVLSIEPGIWAEVAGFLATAVARDFPTNYFIPFHIEERERRLAQRAETTLKRPVKLTSRVLCNGKLPRFDAPIVFPETGAYRLNIVSRGSNGEPHFKPIPKEIWARDKEGAKSAASAPDP